MKNLIEITTDILGGEICELLGKDFDFGRLASNMIDSEGNSFYEYEGEKLSLQDTQDYQAFHVLNKALGKANTGAEKFDRFGGLKGFIVPLTFLLFGWVETQGNEWEILQLFESEYHRINGESTELTAKISLDTMDPRPATIIRKYFHNDWPNVVHKQGQIIAFEINYTATVSTCIYCFE